MIRGRTTAAAVPDADDATRLATNAVDASLIGFCSAVDATADGVGSLNISTAVPSISI